jgi:hypothetical protein
MHPEDSSFPAEDQFSIDASAFIIEPIPNTGIKLLRAKLETEPALSRQLDIPRRLELLRRGAARSTSPNRTPSTSPSQQPASLQDVPIPGSGPADSHFLQDVASVGETSRGETVYLVLSVVTDHLRWQGGWFLGLVPPGETEVWQAHLTSAREQFVRELQQQSEVQA